MQQPDEYETDSDTESDEEDDFEVVLKQDMHDQYVTGESRSMRPMSSFFSFFFFFFFFFL